MPTYEFECEDCNIAFEMILGINDLHIGECPECDKITNKRIFSPFAVIDKTPHTLGGLADQRRKEMGELCYQETLKKMADERRAAASYKGIVPEGATAIDKPESTRPWYRPDMDKPDTKIFKAPPEKIHDYVMTGKRPIGTT